MKKLILSIVLALVMMLSIAVPVFAGNEVEVTATPAFVSVSVSPDSWTINGIDGDGKIRLGITYYSNDTGETGDVTAPNETILDGDCYFTATNDGTVSIDIAIDFPDHTGGDASSNSNSGYTTNGANAFGASVYVSGTTWPTNAVIAADSGSAESISNLPPLESNTKKFGIAYKAQSGAWTQGEAMTSTVLLTATEH